VRLLSPVLTTFLAAGLLLAGPPATAAPVRATAPAATGASTFTSLSPVRVLDTRNTGGPVAGGGTVNVDLATHVPATATAVVLNVTGVGPTAPTFVTVYPSGTTRPTTSSLNLPIGDTRPNQVTVMLSADRRVAVYNDSGSVHLIADLAGYYSTGTGARYTALPANRALDTRQNNTPLGPGGTRELDLSEWIPASATAVTVNLTATNVTAPTFVTAWPTGTPLPTASNLNLPPGDTRPNLVTVAVGANRRVSLYNNGGSVDLIADLTGFYTHDYGASFLPQAPTRVLDTRNGTGTGGETDPVGTLPLSLNLENQLPITVTGAVFNITGVDATAATHVTVNGLGLWVTGSTLNMAAGQTVSNAAAVAIGGGRRIELDNNSGTVHLVADLAGVFAVVDTAPCTEDCVQAWGRNGTERALGAARIEQTSSVPSPALISGVRAVASGRWGTEYALRHDGTVWAWGDNDWGQLGNGWRAPDFGGSTTPVPVVGLTGITAVASGQWTGYALRGDGTVWAWGGNLAGELGNGTNTHRNPVPVQVSGLTGVVAIGSASGTGYALRSDGTVWAWGSNGDGELGNGSTNPSPVPVQVSGLTGITAISSGSDANSAYAVRNDGTVWAWGIHSFGQLGNGQGCVAGQACFSRVPVQVSGLTGVVAVASDRDNGYAVRDDGTVWAWGSSAYGRLGNGVACEQYTRDCVSRIPVQVSNLSGVTRVAGSDYGGLALRADGTVAAWGDNVYDTLADEDVYPYARVPVPVEGVTGASAVTGGNGSGFALVPNP
jgi:alpha-tubulin suppressor-like RCC1 family protein